MLKARFQVWSSPARTKPRGGTCWSGTLCDGTGLVAGLRGVGLKISSFRLLSLRASHRKTRDGSRPLHEFMGHRGTDFGACPRPSASQRRTRRGFYGQQTDSLTTCPNGWHLGKRSGRPSGPRRERNSQGESRPPCVSLPPSFKTPSSPPVARSADVRGGGGLLVGCAVEAIEVFVFVFETTARSGRSSAVLTVQS